jgi:hypothetical protein
MRKFILTFCTIQPNISYESSRKNTKIIYSRNKHKKIKAKRQLGKNSQRYKNKSEGEKINVANNEEM